MTTVIIVCIIISILSFLILKGVNSNAEQGILSPTPIIYLNGCLNYQSGVEVKIQADSNNVTIDKNFHIPIQKITEIQITKTKQLTEQQKNIIGRAIIGTLLAGELGGIIGGLSGVGTTKKTEEVEILYIIYKDNKEKEQTISFALLQLAEKSFFLNSWIYGVSRKIKINNNLVVN